MIDERRVEAINRELDGVSTPEESAALKTLLASDEEARATFEHLSRIHRLLSEVKPVAPPAALKEGIMAAVAERRAAEAAAAEGHVAQRHPEPARRSPGVPPPLPRKESWLGTIAAGFRTQGRWAFRTQGRWAYAFTFIAGLVVGMAAFGTFGDGLRLDRSQVTGTMVPHTQGLTVIDRADFDEPGFRGDVVTGSVNGLLVAEIELDAVRDVTLTVDFDPQNLVPQGVRGEQPVPGGFAALDGEIRVSHSGKNRYVVSWERKASGSPHIMVGVLDEGTRVEASLRTSPGGEQ
jgi:hypothetical protein